MSILYTKVWLHVNVEQMNKHVSNIYINGTNLKEHVCKWACCLLYDGLNMCIDFYLFGRKRVCFW